MTESIKKMGVNPAGKIAKANDWSGKEWLLIMLANLVWIG